MHMDKKNPVPCLGFFEAELYWKNSKVKDDVYVIRGDVEALLGRVSSFSLNNLDKRATVETIKHSADRFQKLFAEYGDLFKGLGKVNGCTHKVTVDPSVPPVAQKLRQIPCHIKRSMHFY